MTQALPGITPNYRVQERQELITRVLLIIITPNYRARERQGPIIRVPPNKNHSELGP